MRACSWPFERSVSVRSARSWVVLGSLVVVAVAGELRALGAGDGDGEGGRTRAAFSASRAAVRSSSEVTRESSVSGR